MSSSRFLWIIAAAISSLSCNIATDTTGGEDTCVPPFPIVTRRGTTSLSEDPPGGTTDDNFFPLIVPQHPVAVRSVPPPPDGAPTPAPKPVTTDNPGAFGFNGLTHLDQLLAGTGEYAGTQLSLEPPDVPLCAGNGFVLQAVNLAITAYDTSGNRLVRPKAVNQFFRLRPLFDPETQTINDFTADPKCYFDPEVRRWFLTVLQIDSNPDTPTPGTRAHLELAVSQGDDPTGDWSLYEVDTTSDGMNGTPAQPGCPCYGDQPLIGTDAFGFHFSVNLFSLGANSQFEGAQVYSLQKSALVAGQLPNVFVNEVPLTELAGASLQPALIPPNGAFETRKGGTEYFMSSILADAPQERISVWAATNTSSLEECAPEIPLEQVFVPSELYAPPPPALQKPGPTPLRDLLRRLGFDNPLERLNTNDARMNQVYFADGKLWSGLNTAVASPERAGIAWFIVEPDLCDALDAEIVNQGYIALNDTNSVHFPAVAVNAEGKGVIGYSLSGPDFFPSVAYSFLDEEHGAGVVHLIGEGAKPEDGFSGYAPLSTPDVARWGDYSGAAVADDGSIWLAAEYIPDLPRSLLANWGTFIAHVDPNVGDVPMECP